MRIGAPNCEIVRPLWKTKWPNLMIWDSLDAAAEVSFVYIFHQLHFVRKIRNSRNCSFFHDFAPRDWRLLLFHWFHFFWFLAPSRTHWIECPSKALTKQWSQLMWYYFLTQAPSPATCDCGICITKCDNLNLKLSATWNHFRKALPHGRRQSISYHIHTSHEPSWLIFNFISKIHFYRNSFRSVTLSTFTV